MELLKTFLCLGWYGRPQPCTEAGGKTGTGSREVNCSGISNGVSRELHHLRCSQVGCVRSKQWKNTMFCTQIQKAAWFGGVVFVAVLFCLVWLVWFGVFPQVFVCILVQFCRNFLRSLGQSLHADPVAYRNLIALPSTKALGTASYSTWGQNNNLDQGNARRPQSRSEGKLLRRGVGQASERWEVQLKQDKQIQYIVTSFFFFFKEDVVSPSQASTSKVNF